ncbi:helix-turn-helix domain-containing protein [Halobacillus yeomjeoni]|uniref:Helix-turn-helix domain-containing protein n=1 Tax=Halobacillus yeomjeoni TaxID=311194 RepID=A0A931HTX6_9BACI|nr:RodZ domain-containing protein [Halobacillus yeomjeoni]MBH0229343.1 helix-turn-helix domain-containing protein [Halobacillus yeomjeoni]
MDMEIGQRLKEARESKGLSLEEVQETTKIQKRYLQAIEKNEFSVLPGKFYTRAFIREYASAVGLDPEQVMEEHESELPTFEDEGFVQYSRVNKAKTNNAAQSSKAFKLFPSIMTVLLVVGILFMVWAFLLNGNDSNGGSTEGQAETGGDDISVPEQTEEPADEEEPKEEGNSDQSSDEEGESTDSGSSDEEEKEEEPAEELQSELVQEGSGSFPEHVYTITGVEDPKVTIEITGRTYLEVKAPKGGESLISPIEYTAEDSPIELDMTGKEQLHVKTGNAPAVVVNVNGQPVEFPKPNISTQKLLLNFQ